MTRTGDSRLLLEELVATPSPNPPGDERGVAEVIVRACSRLDLPAPRVIDPVDGRPNVIVRLGSGRRPRLLLVAHMDTMPPGDLEQWASDPFALELSGDRLVGLGSADMKGAIAAVLVSLARIATPPSGTIDLVLTADEEGGSLAGMRQLMGHLGEADHAVVLEPAGAGGNSWQYLYVAELGSCVFRLEAYGEPGHSGQLVAPQRRASDPLSIALRRLIEDTPLSHLRHPVDGSPAVVNVGTQIFGGVTPFAHPDRLCALVEVRTHDGVEPGLVLELLRGCLAPLGDRVALVPVSNTPTGRECTDAHLLDVATAAWRETLGSEPDRAVLRAGTDGAYLSELGIPTLPAYGPGSLAVAHAPNEYLPVEDLAIASELYERFLSLYFAPRRTGQTLRDALPTEAPEKRVEMSP